MRILRRTRFLIDEFQYRILFLHVLYFVALILVFTAAIFVPLIMELQSGALSFAERHAVANQFLSLHSRIWPAVLILFVLLSAHSVFVSHRIAGPLYRFRKVMKSVASGDLSIRFTLRKKDYLVKEANLFAEMIAALRHKVGNLQGHCSELEALVEELRMAADNNSADEIQSRLERLRAEMAKLKAAADEFTTEHTSPHAATQETEAPIGSARVPNEA